jgi:hypothetical protein
MLVFLIALAGTAVVFADVLVRPGMLLEPVQRWVREWYSKPYRPAVMLKNPGWPEFWPEHVRGLGAEVSKELDQQWWWAPLWGCYKCVAGQWGFWGYLIRYHSHYNFFQHLAFTAFTIIAAIILHKWTQD